MDCEMDSQNGDAWSDADVVRNHFFEEGAMLKDKTFDLPVDLHSNPHLWLLALGSDWKNESEMSFLCRVAGMSLRDKVWS